MDYDLREHLANEFADIMKSVREEKWDVFSEAASQIELDPYVTLARLLVRVVEHTMAARSGKGDSGQEDRLSSEEIGELFKALLQGVAERELADETDLLGLRKAVLLLIVLTQDMDIAYGPQFRRYLLTKFEPLTTGFEDTDERHQWHQFFLDESIVRVERDGDVRLAFSEQFTTKLLKELP